jgi:hypothetical protein
MSTERQRQGPWRVWRLLAALRGVSFVVWPFVGLGGAGVAAGLAANVAVAASCAGPEFHQLDFRLGSFNAKTAGGIQAGQDRADRILSGCGIVEQWSGAVSGQGQSVTAFDIKDRQWHMLFVNDTGNVLQLTGSFAGAALVLTGENYTFDGRYGLHRMSWSPMPAGGFRQLWELSTDRGKTWSQIFDGRFTRID